MVHIVYCKFTFLGTYGWHVVQQAKLQLAVKWLLGLAMFYPVLIMIYDIFIMQGLLVYKIAFGLFKVILFENFSYTLIVPKQ